MNLHMKTHWVSDTVVYWLIAGLGVFTLGAMIDPANYWIDLAFALGWGRCVEQAHAQYRRDRVAYQKLLVRWSETHQTSGG